MTAEPNTSELNKFQCILQLSADQIRALKRDDFPAFQKLLTAKGALINSLKNGGAAVADDPALSAIILEIKASEKAAEMLLEKRIEAARVKLQQVKQSKSVRRAYSGQARNLPAFVPSQDTPKFFDAKL